METKCKGGLMMMEQDARRDLLDQVVRDAEAAALQMVTALDELRSTAKALADEIESDDGG